MGTRGDIIIEDNDFSGQGDDSLNIHGLFLPVTAVLGEHGDDDRLAHGLVQVGDVIRFVRRSDLAERWRATVVSLNSINGPDYVATFDAAPPADLAIGDLGGNVTRNNARFLVRNNVFHDHRARGMLIQAPLGLVENNVIRDVTMQGMHLTTDAKFFFESTGLGDVVVRGNTISGVGYGSWEIYGDGRHMAAISLIGDVAAGITSHHVHQNVVIEDNTITDTPALAILVGSANGVTVQGNTIVHSNQIPFGILRSGTDIDATARGSIMVTRATNVTVRENHEVIAAGRPDRGVYVDVRNTQTSWSLTTHSSSAPRSPSGASSSPAAGCRPLSASSWTMWTRLPARWRSARPRPTRRSCRLRGSPSADRAGTAESRSRPPRGRRDPRKWPSR